jgi:hypothetical protein
VKVIFDGGGAGNTNNLGALPKGVASFSLGAHTTWEIHVTKSTAQVWTQISSVTNVFNQFFSPRSVAVKRNPASPYFGRVYVMEHGNSTGSGTMGSGRPFTKGIYALNSDSSDALGQGNAGLTGALDALNIFAPAANSSYEPWKIVVGEDDYVYVSDAQNPRGALARVNPNLPEAVQDPCLRSSDPKCYEKNKNAYVPFRVYSPSAAEARESGVIAPVGATSSAAASGSVGGGATGPIKAPKASDYAVPPGSDKPKKLSK